MPDGEKIKNVISLEEKGQGQDLCGMGKRQIYQAQTPIPRPMGLLSTSHVASVADLQAVNTVCVHAPD